MCVFRVEAVLKDFPHWVHGTLAPCGSLPLWVFAVCFLASKGVPVQVVNPDMAPVVRPKGESLLAMHANKLPVEHFQFVIAAVMCISINRKIAPFDNVLVDEDGLSIANHVGILCGGHC